ncbi:MAG: DUF4097 family beta strand repeat-containing protein [Balneolaceae bacterium]
MNKRDYYKLITGSAAALLVMLVSATSIVAQDAYLTEEFGVSNNVKVEVKTSGGSIEVVGENSDEVRVEMYVRKRGKYIDPDEADLKDWEITIEKSGNTVSAIAKREGRNRWRSDNYSISFKVYTPANAVTDLRTSGGSISLENLNGTQYAKTSGGSIKAESIGGDVELKTSGGAITINEIEGSVDANTSGGRIRAEDISGGITAKTSGGSITLAGISGNVEAKTSGGSINVEVLNPDNYIELRTSGGSISVTIPKDQGYDIDLDGNRVRADLENFRGAYEKDEIEGTLNGGGTKLTAKTSGGSVNLKYL